MVAWLASTLESNAERAKTIVDPTVAAPDGFFANINSVLLSLCQPFLEPSSDLAWRRIDARYPRSCPPPSQTTPQQCHAGHATKPGSSARVMIWWADPAGSKH